VAGAKQYSATTARQSQFKEAALQAQEAAAAEEEGKFVATTIDVEPVAAKIVQFAATHTNNYWSPLACLVEEQEEISEQKILASNPPILDADRSDRTGLWKLPLDD
jgi:hypothetical protein